MPASGTSRASRFAAALVVAIIVAAQPWGTSAWAWGSERVVGSGNIQTATRGVSGFHALALHVPAKLELRQGAREAVSITGDDNILALIETVVENGTLKIRWANKRDYSISGEGITLVVDVKAIDSLAIGGSGEIHAARLETGTLHALVAGSSGMAIDSLQADSVSAGIDGSGFLDVAGRVDTLEVGVAGSGRLSAAKLESRSATITLAGSGRAALRVKETLHARVAGSGAVTYYGTPEVTKTIAGSGTITQAGAT